MDSSNDSVDASNVEIGDDAKNKHTGQLAHRFVSNFQIHEEEQTRCGTCGDEKVCVRCSHFGKKECETCGMFVSRIAEHRRIHTGERPFKCARCLASFKQKHHLEYHLRRHTGEKPFLCEKCGLTFSRRVTLEQHQAGVHSTVKQHQCEQCGRSFTQRQGLMRHKRRVHRQVYTCRQCNEILPTRDAFTEHCLIHSGKAKQVEEEDVEDVQHAESSEESEEDEDIKSEKMLE